MSKQKANRVKFNKTAEEDELLNFDRQDTKMTDSMDFTKDNGSLHTPNTSRMNEVTPYSNCNFQKGLLKKKDDLNFTTQTKKEKRVGFVYEPEKPMTPFINDCPKLKNFMTSNFSDDQLIDYDFEHRDYDRKTKGYSQKEIEEELKDESQRFWKLLTEHVIFRDSTILNKY